jgi:hypothetical protein
VEQDVSGGFRAGFEALGSDDRRTFEGMLAKYGNAMLEFLDVWTLEECRAFLRAQRGIFGLRVKIGDPNGQG